MSASLDEEILAAEQRRCAAMLAGDVHALEQVLDGGLQFSHATGAVDDRPAYLAKLSAGRIKYLAIDWSEARVVELAQHAALLSGRMASTVEVDGATKRLDNRVLSVWRRQSGQAWRLIAFQSTPLKL